MQAIDFLKAFAAAIVLMILNLAASWVAVAIYAYMINPGHEDAFYHAAAQDIAPWSSVIAGFFLFFAAGYWFAKRKPERNGIAFGLAMAAGYAIVDASVLISMGVILAMTGIFVLSMGTKAIAAVLGAIAAGKSSPPSGG